MRPRPPEPDRGPGRTPAGGFYGDLAFAAQRERLFPRTWHLAPLDRGCPQPGHVTPWTMLPGTLDEPLLWSCDAGGATHCLANVCTHRGKVVIAQAGPRNAIRCDYHGRCFDLAGRLRSAPGFEAVAGFPQPADDLPAVPWGAWAGFRFAAIAPTVPFAEWIRPVADLLSWWTERSAPQIPVVMNQYEFDANWALYVDNYLEGFHIPYVHPGLSRALAVADYDYEQFAWGTLQIGVAKVGEPTLALQREHRLAGRRVGALYLWLFPCTMLNVYPWGISVNVVEPLAPGRTRVRYLSYVTAPELAGQGAGAELDTVEREDQAVVVATQRGVASRFYRGGRYAPVHEAGVQHFHGLLAALLAPPPADRSPTDPPPGG